MMISTPTPDQTELRDILSENFYWKMVDGEKVVHLNQKQALAAISKLMVLERIDELKELQMCPNIADELKDEIYRVHIKDRISKLKKGI